MPHPLYLGKLGRPQSQSGCYGKGKNPASKVNPTLAIHSVACRYTDRANLNPLFQMTYSHKLWPALIIPVGVQRTQLTVDSFLLLQVATRIIGSVLVSW
jgi:hypothetical protein